MIIWEVMAIEVLDRVPEQRSIFVSEVRKINELQLTSLCTGENFYLSQYLFNRQKWNFNVSMSCLPFFSECSAWCAVGNFETRNIPLLTVFSYLFSAENAFGVRFKLRAIVL